MKVSYVSYHEEEKMDRFFLVSCVNRSMSWCTKKQKQLVPEDK